MSMEIKPLSDAEHFEEFTNLRNAARTAELKAWEDSEDSEDSAETAEPKSMQPEEGKTEIVADPVTAETKVQEVPAKASVEDQIKALRAKGKHAQANKLMAEDAAEQAARPHREEAEKLRKELEGLRTRPAEPKPTTQAVPAQAKPSADAGDPEPQPTEDKYAGADGYLKYQRDLTRWDVRQENRAIEQKKQDASIGEKITQKWNAAKGKYPDFEAATHPNTGLIPTNPMKQFIIEHDLGMDVLYQLGKDLPEFSRISQLTPVMQMAELGYMARLIATPPPAQASTPEKQLKPAVSKASTPPRVLGGANASEPKPLSEAQTFEDFQRRRTALKAS